MRKVVGEEGKITQRIMPSNASGAWVGMVDSVNNLIGDLVWPTSEMTRVIGAVARGDLSQTMALEVEGRQLAGEFQRTSKTVNIMVDHRGSRLCTLPGADCGDDSVTSEQPPGE